MSVPAAASVGRMHVTVMDMRLNVRRSVVVGMDMRVGVIVGMIMMGMRMPATATAVPMRVGVCMRVPLVMSMIVGMIV